MLLVELSRSYFHTSVDIVVGEEQWLCLSSNISAAGFPRRISRHLANSNRRRKRNINDNVGKTCALLRGPCACFYRCSWHQKIVRLWVSSLTLEKDYRAKHCYFNSTIGSAYLDWTKRPKLEAISDPTARGVAEKYFGVGERVFDVLQASSVNSSYFSRSGK